MPPLSRHYLLHSNAFSSLLVAYRTAREAYRSASPRRDIVSVIPLARLSQLFEYPHGISSPLQTGAVLACVRFLTFTLRRRPVLRPCHYFVMDLRVKAFVK